MQSTAPPAAKPIVGVIEEHDYPATAYLVLGAESVDLSLAEVRALISDLTTAERQLSDRAPVEYWPVLEA